MIILSVEEMKNAITYHLYNRSTKLHVQCKNMGDLALNAINHNRIGGFWEFYSTFNNQKEIVFDWEDVRYAAEERRKELHGEHIKSAAIDSFRVLKPEDVCFRVIPTNWSDERWKELKDYLPEHDKITTNSYYYHNVTPSFEVKTVQVIKPVKATFVVLTVTHDPLGEKTTNILINSIKSNCMEHGGFFNHWATYNMDSIWNREISHNRNVELREALRREISDLEESNCKARLGSGYPVFDYYD
jgi:hypothetical protein